MKKIRLSELKDAFHATFDLFICASSFEERCVSIPQSMCQSIYREAFVVYNADCCEYSHIISTNVDRLFRQLKPNSKKVPISISDPLVTADSIDHAISTMISEKIVSTILFDITAFTHEALLIVYKLLQMRCPEAKVTYVYANAAEYSLNDDVASKWLSNGIGEIRTVLGYPGVITPIKKTHLILIVGYEYARANAVIEAIEPDTISLGYGRSNNATTDKDKDANEHYKILVERMAASYSVINSFDLPCNDPFQASICIQEQIDNAKDNNILLVPMNNKISTLGAALAADRNSSVQICYAPAQKYNYENYSSPGLECYIIEY